MAIKIIVRDIWKWEREMAGLAVSSLQGACNSLEGLPQGTFLPTEGSGVTLKTKCYQSPILLLLGSKVLEWLLSITTKPVCPNPVVITSLFFPIISIHPQTFHSEESGAKGIRHFRKLRETHHATHVGLHKVLKRQYTQQVVISLMIRCFINPTRESRWLSRCESLRPPSAGLPP